MTEKRKGRTSEIWKHFEKVGTLPATEKESFLNWMNSMSEEDFTDYYWGVITGARLAATKLIIEEQKRRIADLETALQRQDRELIKLREIALDSLLEPAFHVPPSS